MRDLSKIRVLIVGWKPNTNQFMRSILASLGLPAFSRIARTDEALFALREHGYEVVFCTNDAEPHDPASFANAVRHDVLSRDPTIPIFVVTSGSNYNEVESIRDSGADDIFFPPMSADQIDKRLKRVLFNIRRFVAERAYVGPDRRRAGDREFRCQDRRISKGVTFAQPPRIGGD